MYVFSCPPNAQVDELTTVTAPLFPPTNFSFQKGGSFPRQDRLRDTVDHDQNAEGDVEHLEVQRGGFLHETKKSGKSTYRFTVF